MRIIGIGDLVTDFYYKNGNLLGVNGGMTTHNIIANLAKLGLKTSVYGVCGNDDVGGIAIKSLKDNGVNVSNIKTINGIKTRCFHISSLEENGNLEFTSTRRCPICNEKSWYIESKIDPQDILQKITKDDVLIFDNLNHKNQYIIDNCSNRKMLDLGQYVEFDSCTNAEIIEKIKNKFDILNLNELVERYFKKRFLLKESEEIFNILKPKMLIVTRGKNGSDFLFENCKISKKLTNPATEVDPTGAGDSFFSIFIYEYLKNNYIIDNNFIDLAFEKATNLTRKVVTKFGARGHIQKLYRIKKINNSCTCGKFDIEKI